MEYIPAEESCDYNSWKPVGKRFDVGELSEDGPEDWEGLDASAAHIANLLSTEPADVKVGIGGFSMGAAIALYSATCFAMGRYGNGIPYPVNLRAVVGLSGWLPGSRSLRNKIEVSHEAKEESCFITLLLCHGISLVITQFQERWMKFPPGLVQGWCLRDPRK
ncbi:Phospholipase/carboxylesterase/thioesterase [Sesbania bispinosa]|nr:Phospholipase/carboxylesterase/thioesterase [Sesbania bispinosa]